MKQYYIYGIALGFMLVLWHVGNVWLSTAPDPIPVELSHGDTVTDFKISPIGE